MMYEEFKELSTGQGKNITLEDYELIEFVYTYHPLNLEKQACANLYDEFGKIIFLDMLPRAKKAARMEVDLRIAKQKWSDINEKYNHLSDVSHEEYDLEI